MRKTACEQRPSWLTNLSALRGGFFFLSDKDNETKSKPKVPHLKTLRELGEGDSK